MSKESKRIDLIMDEIDRQPLVDLNAGRPVVAPKKTVSGTANDYLDLYQNFAEFNAKNNPEKVNELMVDSN